MKNWQLVRDFMCFDPTYMHDIIESVLKENFKIEVDDRWGKEPAKDCNCAISEKGFLHCLKISVNQVIKEDVKDIWTDFLQKLDEQMDTEIE